MELTNLIGRNLLEWTLLGVFAFSFLLQIFYLIYFYTRLLRVKQPERKKLEESISVLLCIRNEEDRILRVLESINEQSYLPYELIVVDDFSEDRTLQYIGSIAKKYPRTRITSLGQETRFSEKISLNLGLKASKNDWVLYLPVSFEKLNPDVLTNMNYRIADDVDVVIGYTNYNPLKGGVNRLLRIERFWEFMRSAGYSMAGLPFVFSEYNICFNKNLYFDHDGFKGKLNQYHANLELILNEHMKKVEISFSEESFIHEDEPVQAQDYTNLIRKEMLLRKALGFKRRTLLLLEDFSRLLFVVSFVLLLIFKLQAWVYTTSLFLLLNILFIIIVKNVADRLNEEKIFISSFVYILIKPLINIYHFVRMYVQDQRSKWN
ncbi:glycosyltransferase family 2 protein [Sunxiuqinia sp. A32]|uniref:glycosyltransferase family 2 protein n=1 Tax=Sunxiuqinia sp. A32 TaxID=3461496 RepID=UPI004045F279